jgi:hypothetical protein|tara:strand:+ start:1769 stop:2167 length:399 start_codon:yes stop_codon:yes gene_type:complete
MKIANRNALLKLCERRYIDLELADAGITVRIQSLSEKEKSSYETRLIAKSGRGILRDRLQDATRRLIALCLVDDKNERIFTDSDVSQIGEMDSFVSSRIYDAAQEHCGFNKGDIQETVEKCESITVDDSLSD